jgi:hypothetical protein
VPLSPPAIERTQPFPRTDPLLFQVSQKLRKGRSDLILEPLPDIVDGARGLTSQTQKALALELSVSVRHEVVQLAVTH